MAEGKWRQIKTNKQSWTFRNIVLSRANIPFIQPWKLKNNKSEVALKSKLAMTAGCILKSRQLPESYFNKQKQTQKRFVVGRVRFRKIVSKDQPRRRELKSSFSTFSTDNGLNKVFDFRLPFIAPTYKSPLSYRGSDNFYVIYSSRSYGINDSKKTR